jgi:uncharacterized membrane protein YgaE (UPF0421/DUF939 family)
MVVSVAVWVTMVVFGLSSYSAAVVVMVVSVAASVANALQKNCRASGSFFVQ